MKICVHCSQRFATADWTCPACRRTLPMVDGFVAFAPDLAHENIGAFDVLEHIQEDTAVLPQLFQATRPGGGIMLTVPQHPYFVECARRLFVSQATLHPARSDRKG